MDWTMETADWIGAYLDWTETESFAGAPEYPNFYAMEPAGTASANEFTAAFLDWMDAPPPARKRGTRLKRAGARRAEVGGAYVFREALLVALQTESDCIQFLRQILDAGGATTRTLGIASEALVHAERLLEDERRAWRALAARYPWDAKAMSPASPVEMEMNWPHALEDVAADVHALRGTVEALQSH